MPSLDLLLRPLSLSDTSTTRAWRVREHDWLPGTMELIQQSTTEPSEAEVQVQVKFAGIHSSDLHLASQFRIIIQKFPRTPAAEFSGVITAVGPGTHPAWATKGRRVYGFFSPAQSHRDQRGSLQEIMTAPTKFNQPTPDDFTDEEVAGVTMSGLAALALTDAVKKNDRILLVGGSTLAGLLAADLAFAKGASYIVATASAALSRTEVWMIS